MFLKHLTFNLFQVKIYLSNEIWQKNFRSLVWVNMWKTILAEMKR